MSFEDIIQIIKALFSGKKGLIEVVRDDPRLILVPFIVTLLGLVGALVRQEKPDRSGAAIVCFVLAGLLTIPLFVPIPGLSGAAGHEPTSKSSPQVGGAQNISFRRLPDTTLTGRDLLTTRPVLPLEDCERTCAKEMDCVAYVRDGFSGTCQLKKEVGTLQKFEQSTSGVRANIR